MKRTILCCGLLAAAPNTAQANARLNILDAADGIGVATGLSRGVTGLFGRDAPDAAAVPWARVNHGAGRGETVTIQANGRLHGLYPDEPMPEPAHRRPRSAALPSLAPTRDLDETRALVEAALAVARVGRTSRTEVGNVVLYLDSQGSGPARCGMERL